MDIALAKFMITCFVCDLIMYTAGVPLKDTHYQGLSTKVKRSPADNFSFGFGISPAFSVSGPIIYTNQRPYSSYGNYIRPPTPFEKESDVNLSATERTTYSKPNFGMPFINEVRVSNTMKGTGPSNILKSNTESTNIVFEKHNPKYYNHKEATDNASKTQTVDVNSRGSFDKGKKKANKTQEIEIDKELIDAIFRDYPSTTEETLVDYTTETGEYESTTTDELLRIPSEVVASLLG